MKTAFLALIILMAVSGHAQSQDPTKWIIMDNNTQKWKWHDVPCESDALHTCTSPYYDELGIEPEPPVVRSFKADGGCLEGSLLPEGKIYEWRLFDYVCYKNNWVWVPKIKCAEGTARQHWEGNSLEIDQNCIKGVWTVVPKYYDSEIADPEYWKGKYEEAEKRIAFLESLVKVMTMLRGGTGTVSDSGQCVTALCDVTILPPIIQTAPYPSELAPK